VKTLLIALLLALSAAPFARADDAVQFGLEPGAPVAHEQFEARKRYRELKRLIESGQHSRYADRRGELSDYPLFAYLEYTWHAYRMSRMTPRALEAFAATYPDTPLPGLLRSAWLRHLGQRGQWRQLATHYTPGSGDDKLACHYANALYRTGQDQAAHAATRELWLVGASQPDACDAAFRLWRDAGQLSGTLAWERFELALARNRYKLASYLVRFIPNEERALANKFREVHQRPQRISAHSRYRADGPRERRLILHGVRRLARRSAADAYAALRTYETSHDFTRDELRETYVYVGKRLASDYSGDPLIYDVPIDAETSHELLEARLRYALRKQDWSEVLVGLHRLPEARANSNRWRYWRARALLESSDAIDLGTGRTLLEALATTRSFYGFLAADILGQEYNFRHEPKYFTADEVRRVEEIPGVHRAYELLALDEVVHARREWRFTTTRLTPRQQEIAAKTARRWGWHERAIRSMIDAEAWNDLDVRFPLAHQDEFTQHAMRENIPLTWAYAITRQESAFMTDAKSGAGARGLMQLMPATARLVAGRTGIRIADEATLYEPEVNIRLGTAYLGEMLRRFDQNRLVASAAYNAGPMRAARWMDASLPLDIWVETIPFVETRDYVQNVAMFAAIYATRMGLSQPLIYPHEYRGFGRLRAPVRRPVNGDAGKS
tara:strand:- start:264 stop:2273 length:2010 start_codon:yes stop_codon:yes gene_type:complete